jgi:large subunit ribosomal protein L15
MKFNELQAPANKTAKRAGRGIAAGRGKTAGRGTKGQKSRAGSGRKPGFEGGQNPLYKRIPKLRGFKRFWDKPTTITTAKLNDFKGEVDNFTLYEAKLIKNPSAIVRVVNSGELTSKVNVHLQGASEKAIETITKAGGSFTKTGRVKAVSKKDDN